MNRQAIVDGLLIALAMWIGVVLFLLAGVSQ